VRRLAARAGGVRPHGVHRDLPLAQSGGRVVRRLDLPQLVLHRSHAAAAGKGRRAAEHDARAGADACGASGRQQLRHLLQGAALAAAGRLFSGNEAGGKGC
jgi:hypothetical protein